MKLPLDTVSKDVLKRPARTLTAMTNACMPINTLHRDGVHCFKQSLQSYRSLWHGE